MILALLLAAARTDAQLPPHSEWRTIRTEHFRITYAPELEPIARRTAARAEAVYAELSRYLRPPRGTVDVVVTDNVDFANGYATVFPSSRVVLYANPPITSGSLRFADDPTELLVAHELLHVFQLDRAGGVWKVLQRVFGRAPFFFPNAYQPSWLLEGLAVHYETKLTGSGRLAGSGHRMIARTAAMSHAVPRLDQLSLANPRFPYGYSTYAYGSLFIEYLAQIHGDSALLRFVESSSRNLLPLWPDAPARRAFGRSLTRAYAEWSRSLIRDAPPWQPPLPGWRDLTVDGAFASFPRWSNDSTLLYSGTSGRETYGVYGLTVRSAAGQREAEGGTTPEGAARTMVERRRLARRHSGSPNTVLSDGSLLYSQLEFSDPYHLRSDLYVDRPGGRTVRLTRNARLAIPDARRDGLIVAMQTVPAGTRLALVSEDGSAIRPITSGGPDEQWAEPRWSPDGLRIAAIRWTLGGFSEVVLLDSAGGNRATLLRSRAVVATPSWSSDGRFVYFSSDHAGITNLYRVAVGGEGAAAAPAVVERVSDATTGLFEPQPSPGDTSLAAVIFRADGYHVGLAPLGEGANVRQAVDTVPRHALFPRALATHPEPQAPSTRYSPWRSLAPRYWLPFWEPALEENSLRLGGFTSGEDLVGRHAYRAQLYVPTDNSGLTGSLYYMNARLGQPVIEMAGSQEWNNFACIADAARTRCIGTLRRRIRDGSVAAVFRRPRARTFSYVTVAGGLEARDYAADSAELLFRVDSSFRRTHYSPRVALSTGWSNTQFPPLAISPEDGVTLAGTSRWRWRSGGAGGGGGGGGGGGSLSLIGTGAAFKSLDLPGFAHHVAALRLAGGLVDLRGTGYLEIGGISGGTLDVVPGYTLGEGRRTFGVRGFPPGSLLGNRAVSGTLEYRAPLVLPGRGLGMLPLFLDRGSLTLFGDAASAWCSGLTPTRPGASICSVRDYDFGRGVVPQQQTPLKPFIHLEALTIASAGAELNLSAALFSWDAPFTYRLGAAFPVAGRSLVGAVKPATFYFAVGPSF